MCVQQHADEAVQIQGGLCTLCVYLYVYIHVFTNIFTINYFVLNYDNMSPEIKPIHIIWSFYKINESNYNACHNLYEVKIAF